MKNKDFTILISALVVLLVLLLLVANPFKGRVASTGKGEMLFPDLLSKDAVTISVDGKNELLLWNQDGEWLVQGEEEGEWFPADTAGVNRALRSIIAATDRELVSRNPEKQGIFEVDSTGTKVEILDADSISIAGFMVGKSSTDYSTNYLRPLDTDDVYVVGQRLKGQFDRARRGLRQMYVLKVQREEIARIDLIREDDSLSLEKQPDGSWALISPEEGKVEEQYSNLLLSTVSNFRGAEIASPDVEAGFETPYMKVVVVLEDGTDRTILIGAISENEDRRYTKLESSKWIYEMSSTRIDNMNKPLDEILEPEPEPVPADSSETVEQDVPESEAKTEVDD